MEPLLGGELQQPDLFSPVGDPDNELWGEARGVNDALVPIFVGWGYDYEMDFECDIRALLWIGANENDDPIILGEAEIPDGEETVAEEINNASPLQVVGKNLFTNHAVIWEETSPGIWDYEDLNSLIDTTNCNFELTDAWDINDNGWIVGQGFVEVLPTFIATRAYLLVPLGPCPEDVNQDGVVDRDDENIIILNGGACPVGRICWADVNGDCVVNAVDQALVRLAILGGTSCSGEAAMLGPCLCPAEMVILFGDDLCACAAWLAELEAAGGL
jgi:hypothetical protein